MLPVSIRILCAVSLLFPMPHACAQATPDQAAQIEAIEKRLLPRIVVTGEEGKTFSLQERMDHFRVPGVSVAVFVGGAVSWANGYGECVAGSGEPVKPDTRFQAASVSKGVAAYGLLLLAQNGRLDLDADVNRYLTRWQLPAFGDGTMKATAKMLLSHTAGLTVHGFPGYPLGAELPTLPQVLDGEKPANTEAVRIAMPPGFMFSYSGGGYTVLQLLTEDITGEPFADYMKTAVLDPLGMNTSTFEHIPADSTNVALAHYGRGTSGDSRWHVYPELAAAGLWTTPADLSKYLMSILRARDGSGAEPLSPDMAKLMTTPLKDNYALGIACWDEDGELVWSHGGSNFGYQCFFKVWPERKTGIVVMTNSNNGAYLYQEIIDAFARRQGYPVDKQQVKPVDKTVDSAAYPQLAGAYLISRIDHPFEVILTDGVLSIRDETSAPWVLHATAPDRFFTIEDNIEITFLRDAEGTVNGATVNLRGARFDAVRR